MKINNSTKKSLLIIALAMASTTYQTQAAPIEHIGDRYIMHIPEMELTGEESLLDVLMMCPEVISLDGNNIINNGDGTVKNPGDMRVIGNSLPRYTYSIRGDLNWNGFDFAVFFQGVGKIDWMPSANCYYFWGPYSFPTTTFIAKDFERLAWSEDNRNTYFPRRRSYQTSSAGSMKVKTDRYLQDASYIRLKNITLGYTIPINKRILEKVRVYVSGENLAYWSPLKRYSKTVDPEVATTSATNDCLYPYSRTFSVGVDITF